MTVFIHSRGSRDAVCIWRERAYRTPSACGLLFLSGLTNSGLPGRGSITTTLWLSVCRRMICGEFRKTAIALTKLALSVSDQQLKSFSDVVEQTDQKLMGILLLISLKYRIYFPITINIRTMWTSSIFSISQQQYTYLRACKKASGWYGSLFSFISDTRNAINSSCNLSVAIWIRGLLASAVDPSANRSLLLQLRLLLDVSDTPVLPNDEDLAYKKDLWFKTWICSIHLYIKKLFLFKQIYLYNTYFCLKLFLI